MPAPKLIASQIELDELVEHISSVSHLALDSESNSFYAYKTRICLIQLSTEQGDYIIDPLVIEDLSPIGRVLADPAVEKVIHAAENDLIGLRKDFKFRVRNIFDTAVACRLLGRKRLGLAGILFEEFGVHMDKKHQRCNWEKRPLSPEQLYYAQLDTRFLIRLRHRLHRRLQERNLINLAQERFARLEKIRFKPERVWKTDDYLRLKGAQQLSAASRRTLKELFAYREYLARKTNKAPFRIINNELLLRLARKMPEDIPSLLQLRGLPSRFKGKGAENLLRIIKRSKS